MFFTGFVFLGYHIVVFFIFSIIYMIWFTYNNLDLNNLPK